MVELVVRDIEVISGLEKELYIRNIEYQLCLDLGRYGIESPYLVVDGVPLDSKRAMKWIRSKDNEH